MVRRSGLSGVKVVVGGGVAGLTAARDLARAGYPVVVLEGGSTGGSVSSRTLDGLAVDVGAEGFATRGGAVVSLLEELGLADRVTSPRPTGTWVHRPDGATRIPDGAVLGIPTRLDDPALDALGEEAAARARQDETLPGTVGADAQTLGTLVRTRMGEGVLRAWPAPLVAGVHRLDIDAVDPEVLLPGVRARLAEKGSLAAALRGGNGELAGLRGGIFQVVHALVGEITTLGGQIVESGAVAVEPDLQGWRVRTTDDAVVHGDGLLLACPPWWWPSGVPEAIGAIARAWPQPRPVDVVTLVVAHDGGGRRAGVIVADGGGRVRARALTYSTAKWDWLAEDARGREVLRLTYDALDDPDDVVTRQALADAAALTGATWTDDDVLAADRTRWLMPRSAIESRMTEQRAAMREAVTDRTDLALTGGWLAGTGLAWTIADARAAAARLLA